jgi:hypothetical protein
MRTVLCIYIEASKGSEALKSGATQKAIGAFVEKFKPEAAYFFAERGMRTAFFVFDMTNSSQQAEISEPFFTLACEVHIGPCMNSEDLQAGLAAAGL